MTTIARVCSSALILTALALAWPAAAAQPAVEPETVLQGMSVKLLRGITNMVTCPAELPKQIHKTTLDMGAPGVLVGLFKGIGMTVYRGATGALETVLFLVPEPGFYASLTTPAYVWQGWSEITPPPPQTMPDNI